MIVEDGAATRLREHELAVNGITLHLATWGVRTTPDRAVLLVHGLTASSRYWAEFSPALAARGWYAIAPDLRGRGRSAKPAHGYGLPFHADDLLALCDALDLPAAHLVGHSLGALIGLFLAALHPERLRRLVLVDAGGKLPADTAQAIAGSLARLGTPYPSLDAYLGAMRRSPLWSWNPFWEAYFRYDAEERAGGGVVSRVPKGAIAEENACNAAIRTEVLPDSVRAPTLIVRATTGLLGADRGLILPAEEAERLTRVIAGSRLVEIPGTNHYTVVLDGRFTQAVTSFLAAPE